MKIAISCDHIVTPIKNEVRDTLISKGYDVIDYGTYDSVRTHYPIYGQKVGEAVAAEIVDFGIVICGTGVGISLGAQKVKGTRVSLVGDIATAKRARSAYDANVLALGGRVTGIGAIMDIVDSFLAEPYANENDELIAKINSLGGEDHIDFSNELELWDQGHYHD